MTFDERYNLALAEIRREQAERKAYRPTKSDYVPTEEHKRIIEQGWLNDYKESQRRGWSTE